MSDGPAIHQFLPRLEWGAVGGHALLLQRLLAELTRRPSDIFADGAGRGMEGRWKPYRSYGRTTAAHDQDLLVYQSATGSPVGDFVLHRRQRLIVNFHNFTPSRYLDPWDAGANQGVEWGERQLRQLAPRTTLAIAASGFNARHLEAAGYPPSRVVVAPVLFEPPTHRGSEVVASPPPAGSPGPDAAATWLFVGRLAPNKCQHRLVAALAAYRQAWDANARLCLVGGGQESRYGRAVADYARALGLEQAVTVTGPVPPSELARQYRRAAVFVCLSEHEGFCIPLVEAMHAGLPVVAAGSTAIPETVGDAGVILPMAGAGSSGVGPPVTLVAAAVDRVVHDRDTRCRVQRAGYARASQLGLDAGRDRFTSLFTPLLGAS